MKDRYKIGEISKLYAIGADSLRYYEKIGALHPRRDANNYRLYTLNDIYRLSIIRDLLGLDFSMTQIKQYLDDQTLDIMKSGGAGVISVVSNMAPALMSELVAAAYDGDYAAADLIDKKLQSLYKECFVESNPIPVKAGLASMGLISNELRLPLVPCRQETYEGMKQIISTLGLGSEE